MALATIPESTAHLYQISLYVDRLADEQGRERVHLDRYVGLNLVYDGVGDVLHGIVGATAGTNYGENNSLMAITRNYSGPALFVAGVICILLAFVGTLSAFVATIPVFVSGGLALYLFGVIGMQGIALMQENKVDLFDPLTLAVGATIMVDRHRRQYRFRGRFPADQDCRHLPERVARDRHRRGGRHRAQSPVPRDQGTHRGGGQAETRRVIVPRSRNQDTCVPNMAAR